MPDESRSLDSVHEEHDSQRHPVFHLSRWHQGDDRSGHDDVLLRQRASGKALLFLDGLQRQGVCPFEYGHRNRALKNFASSGFPRPLFPRGPVSSSRRCHWPDSNFVSKTITALHVVDKDKIVLSIPDKENIENDSDVLAKLVALRLGGSPAIKYRLMVEIPSKGNQQWKSLMDKSSRIVKEIRLGSMGLTGRQVEVLRGIVNGLRNKEISSLLHITERTVKFHVSRLLIKYNCTNRVELSDRCRDLAQEVVMAQLPPASVNDP